MTENHKLGIKIIQGLQKAFGNVREAGSCPDCWGNKYIPSTDPYAPDGAWIECPTCRGTGQGGVA